MRLVSNILKLVVCYTACAPDPVLQLDEEELLFLSGILDIDERIDVSVPTGNNPMAITSTEVAGISGLDEFDLDVESDAFNEDDLVNVREVPVNTRMADLDSLRDFHNVVMGNIFSLPLGGNPNNMMLQGYEIFDEPVQGEFKAVRAVPPRMVPPATEGLRSRSSSSGMSLRPNPKTSLKIQTSFDIILGEEQEIKRHSNSGNTDRESPDCDNEQPIKRRRSPKWSSSRATAATASITSSTDPYQRAVEIICENPSLLLSELLSVSSEAKSLEEPIYRILNLRLMPEKFMDVMMDELRKNFFQLTSDISRIIRQRNIGEAKREWLEIWRNYCIATSNGKVVNICQDMLVSVRLDSGKIFQCYFMGLAHWKNILQQKGRGLAAVKGTTLVLYDKAFTFSPDTTSSVNQMEVKAAASNRVAPKAVEGEPVDKVIKLGSLYPDSGGAANVDSDMFESVIDQIRVRSKVHDHIITAARSGDEESSTSSGLHYADHFVFNRF